jgi:hypothetical protein
MSAELDGLAGGAHAQENVQRGAVGTQAEEREIPGEGPVGQRRLEDRVRAPRLLAARR